MANSTNSSRLLHLQEFTAVNTGTSDPSYKKKPWSVKIFRKGFKIIINSIDESRNIMEFDMIGVDASIANAFRRILIAEVPTMAIDRVFMYNNTSIIQDEVLAHRLGLIPIKADPRMFEYRPEGDEEGSSQDTLEFELKIKCTRNHPSDASGSLYNNHTVYSSDLKFIPRAEQQRMDLKIESVDKDILIAKLRPGHEIDLKAHCIKGIGRDHAKFSPVATASYRLLPEIHLLREISGEDADRFAGCFPEGVVKVVEEKGTKVATIANSRLDTGSRNVFYYEDFRDAVLIGKIKDHFIFTVESTGCLPADELFLEAVAVLKEKCRYFLTQLKSMKMKDKGK